MSPNQNAPMRKINAAFIVLLLGMVGYFVFLGAGLHAIQPCRLVSARTLFGVFNGVQYRRQRCGQFVRHFGGRGTLTVPQALLYCGGV